MLTLLIAVVVSFACVFGFIILSLVSLQAGLASLQAGQASGQWQAASLNASLLATLGNAYAGLIYPIVVAVISIVIGSMFIKESRNVRIWDEVGGHDDDLASAATAP